MKILFLSIFLILGSWFCMNTYGQTEIDHWETIIYASDTWHYQIGSADIPSNWNESTFNDDPWLTGPGGIGYEDGDDATVVQECLSVYMRMDFEITDLSKIQMAILHADYDDAFVAYLNGVEIARANVGSTGEITSWNTGASGNHEAAMYGGGIPEEFKLSNQDIGTVLKNGTNTLAIQVHNTGINSSDLSGIFFFSVAITDNGSYYRELPEWFYETVYEDFTSSNLPLMFIETGGQGINSSSRITADMGLIDNSLKGTRNFLTDSFNAYNNKITIKIRGSSSQGFPKKNYNFETQDEFGENNNVSLLGLPVENDWILHGPYSDKSLIRNVLSYHISASTGEYAPRTRWCELFINDTYQGVYVLTEKIKQDKNRVDIATLNPEDISGDEITGGYIFQIDRNDPEPDDGFYSAYSSNVFYAYQDPGYDELVPLQKAYLKSFISNFEDAARYAANDEDFLPYISVPSFADFFIATEIFNHVDCYRLSFYMYKEKDSDGGRLCFGPIWDLNLAYGNSDFGPEPIPQGWSYTRAETSNAIPFWITDFLESDSIKDCIACKWENLRAGKLNTDSLMNFIEENLEHIDEARLRNFERWPVIGVYVWPNYFVGDTYDEEVEFLKSWLNIRLNWMDNNMVGICRPVGTENEVSPESYVKVFPNPFDDIINFRFGIPATSIHIDIYNSVGTILRTVDTNSSSDIKINLSDLEPGIYFYKITSGNNSFATGKIVRR